jgi:quercetin dioxygenase-like cupin family protein
MADATVTRNKGAVKAGNGTYGFMIADLDAIEAGTGYSTSRGGVLEGERMQVGLIHKARGTGSRAHSHPNEQFNYVLQGTLKVEMDGQEFLAPAGTVVYVPANMVHSMVATQEEDVIFYVVKDLSHGIIGKAADGKMSGAHYDPGFEPE